MAISDPNTEATAAKSQSDSKTESPDSSAIPKSGDAPSSNQTAKKQQQKLKPLSNKVTIYTPDNEIRHPIALFKSIFTDIWTSRELIWRLFSRNIKSLYRQTLMGFFWLFLPPLAAVGMWVFLKMQAGFKFDVGVSYIVYVLTGMILWQGFSEAYQAGLNVVQGNRSMFSKVNVPRESMLMVKLCEVCFNLAIRTAVLIPLLFVFQVGFSWWQLFAIIGVPLIVMLGAGIGLILVPFGALYNDVGKLITILLPFWMICTPIVYPTPESMPSRLVLYANPASPLLVMTRDSFLGIGSAGSVTAPSSEESESKTKSKVQTESDVKTNAKAKPNVKAKLNAKSNPNARPPVKKNDNSDVRWLALVYGLLTIPIFLLGLLVYRASMPIIIERM